METTPSPTQIYQSPRVSDSPTESVETTTTDPTPESPPLSSLTQTSTRSKNAQFPSNHEHRYSLRSKESSPQHCKLRPCTTFNKLQDMAHHGTTRTNFRHLAGQSLTAQHIFNQHVYHVYGPNGKRETINTVIQGAKKELWTRSLSNEWG